MRTTIGIIAGALMALLTTDADAAYRDFCASVPSACVYTGPEAPVLASVVCWSRTTSTATILSGAECPADSYAYFVKYGDVEPLTGQVQAYVPLDDACSRPGLCQPWDLAPVNTTSAAMCCVDGVCTPQVGFTPCAGEVLMCSNGVTNEDGTVECFDDQDA
jgi:hypothetical protein